MEKFFKVILLFFLIINLLNARIVEIYPSLNTIGRWKIYHNISNYSNVLNYVIVSQKNKKELYPVPTNLTKKFIGFLLYLRTVKYVNQQLNYNNEELDDLNLTYNEIDNTLNNIDDPYKAVILFLLLPFDKNPDGKIVSTLAKQLEEYIILGEEKSSNCEKIMALIDANIKAPIIDIITDDYFKQHPFQKVIFDIIWDQVIKEGVNKIVCKHEETKVSVGRYLLDRITINLKAITAILKGINLMNSVAKSENIENKQQILFYLQNFIKDYIFKYNMNIKLMANDCDLSSEKAGNYRINNPTLLHKPFTFFQVFIIYGITHNYLNNINLMDGRNMYYLWIVAHTALDLINRFGDGGNYKIYINVNDKNPINSSINSKTFFTNSLYWMLPLEEKYNIEMIYTDSINNFESFYYNLYLANYNYSVLNPYYYKDVYMKYIKNAQLYNTIFKLVKIDNREFLLFSGIKKINKKEFFIKSFIPIYKISYDKKNLLNIVLIKALKLGLIDYNPNLKEEILDDISYNKLINILYRFSKITSIKEMQNRANINKNLQKIKWSLYIKREEFFRFLVNILNLDHYKDLSLLKKSFGSLCDSKVGCILRKYKISTGKYSNKPLKIWQVLLLLERTEILINKKVHR
ncbi:hypothetical protein FE773_07800 [Caminibacter mediatlanticus TB-2]|uniref:Uncharacterized protein n=1 Tax=Caminibacter mediatlanticus TB-2 TaxID=391592 RepID=A0ABX5V9X8_9BACT|nr:hypothetical protein [Caminibacter mediatlanticus]QCT95095.1 hypothetical protein FE773_07800 [Caminibacter mediatlanticus TB-2]